MTTADDAFNEIHSAIRLSRDFGESEYGLRAVLRIFNIIFTQGEALEGKDIDALYWLTCQAQDTLELVDTSNKRARDIARKQVSQSQEQLGRLRQCMDTTEPEYVKEIRAMLREAFSQDIPFEESIAAFEQAVKEHRGEVTASTPIHVMYLRWMDCRNRYNDNDGGPDSLFDELIDLERKILATRPTTVEDYAFKILVADTDGDMNTNTFQVGMVEEARILVAELPTEQSLKLDA